MIQISFQLFVILISTDVLREIRRDIAENLAKRDFPDRRRQRSFVGQLGERPPNDAGKPRKTFEGQGCFSSQSFWKAGSERKGSHMGSNLRSAGVIGIP
jgi:hypothetical protein